VPAIGDLLVGKYRVAAPLGEGGMGAVFRAENVVTGKQVALKWMHPHVAARAEAVARLVREAQAASRIDHPNIVDVYDIVQDGDTLFMVMELLEGETLSAYLEHSQPPKISEFIALLLPALDGVACAHDAGVIHRDLKPDNVFLVRSRSGRPVSAKVLDFGVAKLATGQGLTLTETGMTMGTPLYMSLEQLRGDKDIDVRTDVYAFGAMLYEAVTGETPFRADTLPELVFKVATTEALPVKQKRSDLPTPLARVIDWAIARERDKRMPDVRALMRELEPFARDHAFVQQMTNPDAALPRLAARVIEPGSERSRSSATRMSRAQPAPPGTRRESAPQTPIWQDAKRSDPDTLRARVIDSQRVAARRSSIGWIAGAVLVGLGLALLVWLKNSQGGAPDATSPTQAVLPAQPGTETTRSAAAQPEPPPTAAPQLPTENAAAALKPPPSNTASAGPAAAEPPAPVTAGAKALPPPTPTRTPASPPGAAASAATPTPAKQPRRRTPITPQPAAAGKSAADLLGF
jgi:serine/threonine protein kinase